MARHDRPTAGASRRGARADRPQECAAPGGAGGGEGGDIRATAFGVSGSTRGHGAGGERGVGLVSFGLRRGEAGADESVRGLIVASWTLFTSCTQTGDLLQRGCTAARV